MPLLLPASLCSCEEPVVPVKLDVFFRLCRIWKDTGRIWVVGPFEFARNHVVVASCRFLVRLLFLSNWRFYVSKDVVFGLQTSFCCHTASRTG